MHQPTIETLSTIPHTQIEEVTTPTLLTKSERRFDTDEHILIDCLLHFLAVDLAFPLPRLARERATTLIRQLERVLADNAHARGWSDGFIRGQKKSRKRRAPTGPDTRDDSDYHAFCAAEEKREELTLVLAHSVAQMVRYLAPARPADEPTVKFTLRGTAPNRGKFHYTDPDTFDFLQLEIELTRLDLHWTKDGNGATRTYTVAESKARKFLSLAEGMLVH